MAAHRYQQAHPKLDDLHRAIAPRRRRVIGHPMYRSLDNPGAITIFMQHHVFAVWDFMSLLKALQQSLTCGRVPWLPEGPRVSRRLINEIVLVEESDEADGDYLSHFELYLEAMEEAGADTAPVMSFTGHLRAGKSVPEAMALTDIPRPAADFMTRTWDLIDSAPVHSQAAAFALGREDLIPEMFQQVIQVDRDHGRLGRFRDYLARHIEVDGDQHTPMAMRMLIDLCGDDDDRWADCRNTADRALDARFALWDGVSQAIERARTPA
jgi:pyrroloquinoline quinone (PQQ) biosynthesis protein C